MASFIKFHTMKGRTVNEWALWHEYDIKDHLGSLRVSFKDSLSIAKVPQESHTGVFGEDSCKFNLYQNAQSLIILILQDMNG
ncbi:MAG: hypothetical protein U5N85_07990 [Arcicella sp.]|nr:hypothetical protein [Arcicella sp.]